MARIRTIKPEFWASEQVTGLSLPARLLFIGMWNFCDDRGVRPASAKTLMAQVFPTDALGVLAVQAMVDELIEAGLVVEFAAGGRRWWAITGWRHQRINRATPSSYPPPPTVNHTYYEADAAAEGGAPAGGAEDSVSAPGALTLGEEGKGKEVLV